MTSSLFFPIYVDIAQPSNESSWLESAMVAARSTSGLALAVVAATKDFGGGGVLPPLAPLMP
jgi:hypothetical protein